MAVDPANVEQVADALRAHLSSHLGTAVTFAEPPQAINDGWETYIYSFALAGDTLPDEWSRPLILRMYPGDVERGAERVTREAAVQRFVVERSFPAPLPLLVEAEANALGRPFMVMERMPGRMLVDAMSAKPWRFGGFVLRMAELHVRLHGLALDGFPIDVDGPLIERKLGELRWMAGELRIDLPQGIDWLEAHKSIVEDETPALCHNDFHPLNIVIEGLRDCSLIDWSGATAGDRHYDIACTLVLLRTAPFEGRNLFEKLLNRLARGRLVSGYRRLYNQRLPIDKERLRYWEALRAYEWRLMIAGMRMVTPEEAGTKSDTPDRIPPELLAQMERYFWQRTKQ
jgi:aminoglycoside phosphotransferase (APT) family kinase protein